MRLIDADKLEYQMLYKENFLKGSGYEAQAIWKEDIESQPIIDAVPVVRCKDCGHFEDYTCELHEYLWKRPEDFCSWGERKEKRNDT